VIHHQFKKNIKNESENNRTKSKIKNSVAGLVDHDPPQHPFLMLKNSFLMLINQFLMTKNSFLDSKLKSGGRRLTF
jgi:hypothetical protein